MNDDDRPHFAPLHRAHLMNEKGKLVREMDHEEPPPKTILHLEKDGSSIVFTFTGEMKHGQHGILFYFYTPSESSFAPPPKHIPKHQRKELLKKSMKRMQQRKKVEKALLRTRWGKRWDGKLKRPPPLPNDEPPEEII